MLALALLPRPMGLTSLALFDLPPETSPDRPSIELSQAVLPPPSHPFALPFALPLPPTSIIHVLLPPNTRSPLPPSIPHTTHALPPAQTAPDPLRILHTHVPAPALPALLPFLHHSSDLRHVLSAVYAFCRIHPDGLRRHSWDARMTISCVYRAAEGTLLLPPETISDLHLLPSSNTTTPSLFDLLNHTLTPVSLPLSIHTVQLLRDRQMGGRRLKQRIQQPSSNEQTLRERHRAIADLLKASETTAGPALVLLRAALQPLRSFDLLRLIPAIRASSQSKARPQGQAESTLGLLLSLQVLLHALPALSSTLQSALSPLLRVIQQTLGHPGLVDLADLLGAALSPDLLIHHGKNALHMRNAKVYAIRSGTSMLLDVARESYKENVADILDAISALGQKYDLPLKATFKASRYLLTIKVKDLAVPLPAEFIRCVRRNELVSCTTLALQKLNARMLDTLSEVYLLSDQIVQGLMQSVAEMSEALECLEDALAELDFIQSLTFVAQRDGYVCPTFSKSTDLKRFRHPILDQLDGRTTVPNDFCANLQSNLFVITGVNMSGKSTYIRGVALIMIMASIGSYVPAEQASIKLVKKMLVRLSHSDSLECSLSTFSREMSSLASLLALADSSSFLIIDELARATTAEEGVGICTAVIEDLISRGCITLFTTHFSELRVSIGHLPGVTFSHLETRGGDASAQALDHTYRLQLGMELPVHYGIQLANLCGMPKQLVDEARQIATALGASSTDSGPDYRTEAERQCQIIRLAHSLCLIADDPGSCGSDVLQKVQQLQDQAQDIMALDAA